MSSVPVGRFVLPITIGLAPPPRLTESETSNASAGARARSSSESARRYFTCPPTTKLSRRATGRTVHTKQLCPRGRLERLVGHDQGPRVVVPIRRLQIPPSAVPPRTLGSPR